MQLKLLLLCLGLLINGAFSYRVVCVYTNWSQYRPEGATFLPEDVDPTLCTHLIYVYAKLKGNRLEPAEWNDDGTKWSEGMYDRVNNLKLINPELKTLLGVGGWTMGSKDFSRMAASRRSRRMFSKSAVKFLRDRNFDGLTIDWQHPTERGGKPKDRRTFSLLLKDIRKEFDQEGKRTKMPPLLLTIGVSASRKIIDKAYEIENITRYTDFINVMAYDLHGAWDNFTGHPSQLYPREEEFGPALDINVDSSMKYWISNVSDRSKLVLGISFYGRTFTLRNSQHHDFMVPTTGPGVAGEYTKQAGMLAHYERCSQYFDANTVWNDEGKVSYWYRGDQWIGAEDGRSVKEKVRWVKRNNIGGVMLGSLDTDDFSNLCSKGKYPLLNAATYEIESSVPLEDIPTRPTPAATKQTTTTFVFDIEATTEEPVTQPPVTKTSSTTMITTSSITTTVRMNKSISTRTAQTNINNQSSNNVQETPTENNSQKIKHKALITIPANETLETKTIIQNIIKKSSALRKIGKNTNIDIRTTSISNETLKPDTSKTSIRVPSTTKVIKSVNDIKKKVKPIVKTSQIQTNKKDKTSARKRKQPMRPKGRRRRPGRKRRLPHNKRRKQFRNKPKNIGKRNPKQSLKHTTNKKQNKQNNNKVNTNHLSHTKSGKLNKMESVDSEKGHKQINKAETLKINPKTTKKQAEQLTDKPKLKKIEFAKNTIINNQIPSTIKEVNQNKKQQKKKLPVVDLKTKVDKSVSIAKKNHVTKQANTQPVRKKTKTSKAKQIDKSITKSNTKKDTSNLNKLGKTHVKLNKKPNTDNTRPIGLTSSAKGKLNTKTPNQIKKPKSKTVNKKVSKPKPVDKKTNGMTQQTQGRKTKLKTNKNRQKNILTQKQRRMIQQRNKKPLTKKQQLLRRQRKRRPLTKKQRQLLRQRNKRLRLMRMRNLKSKAKTDKKKMKKP